MTRRLMCDSDPFGEARPRHHEPETSQRPTTMAEAQQHVPMEWALNCLASRILLDHDFNCRPQDVIVIESAAPSLAGEIVRAASSTGKMLLPPPDGTDKQVLQDYDTLMREVTHTALQQLPTNQREALP